jgi:hypothetical protein
MSFTYSSFISYRRNESDSKFIRNLKDIIAAEAQTVTNKAKVFFDENSIKWGNEFDDAIYDGILSSYFFIPIYHYTYLHVDNVWCAREIYHALQIEEKIREHTANPKYSFILPIIYRGSTDELPDCICKINAKSVRQLEHLIRGKKDGNLRLTEFRTDISNVFHSNFKLIENLDINLKELCNEIEIPNDDQIKDWIKEQNRVQKVTESKKLPILKKTC